MAIKKYTCYKGMSLVEAMVAITVLSIAIFGGSAYRYYSTLDARRADRKMAAARVRRGMKMRFASGMP